MFTVQNFKHPLQSLKAELYTPLTEPEAVELNTRMNEQKRDSTHPYWKEEPAYTYGDREQDHRNKF